MAPGSRTGVCASWSIPNVGLLIIEIVASYVPVAATNLRVAAAGASGPPGQASARWLYDAPVTEPRVRKFAGRRSENGYGAKTTDVSRMAVARGGARRQRTDPRHLGSSVDDGRIRLRAARHRREARRPE